MESKRTATTYFIPPGKFLLMENALGNPDLIQSSVSSDCRVTIVDKENFPLDELEQWPTFRLTAADVVLNLGANLYYIYIVVPMPDNTESTSAFIAYNTALVDRDGYEVLESTDEEGNPTTSKGDLLGKEGFKYYQCGTVSARGSNSSATTVPPGQGRIIEMDLGVTPSLTILPGDLFDWDKVFQIDKVDPSNSNSWLLTILAVVKEMTARLIRVTGSLIFGSGENEKPITDVATSADKDNKEIISDTVLASTAWVDSKIGNLDDRYLSKIHDDRTPYKLNVGDLFTAEKDARLCGTTEMDNAIVNESIHSKEFISGFPGGKGWAIRDIEYPNSAGAVEHRSVAEFDDVIVRGVLRVFEFVVSQMLGENDNRVFTAMLKVDHYDPETGKVWLDTQDGTFYNPFRKDDIILVQQYNGLSSEENDFYITKQYELIIDEVGVGDLALKEERLDWVTFRNFASPMEGATVDLITKGDTFVRIDNLTDPTRKGIIKMMTAGQNTPYMDVIYGQKTDPDNAVKARFGNLQGIHNHMFGWLRDFGAYIANLYAVGEFRIAHTGEDVADKIEMVRGAFRTHFSQSYFEMKDESDYLKNGTFGGELEGWEMGKSSTQFMTVDGIAIYANRNLMTGNDTFAGRATYNDKDMLRIFNSDVKQLNADIRKFGTHKEYVPMDGSEEEPSSEYKDVPDTAYLTMRLFCDGDGTVEVGFDNGDTEEGALPFVELDVVKRPEEYIIVAEGVWNGEGDFVIRCTGDIYVEYVTLTDRPLDNMKVTTETWIEQDAGRIALLGKKIDDVSGAVTDLGIELDATNEQLRLYVDKTDENTASISQLRIDVDSIDSVVVGVQGDAEEAKELAEKAEELAVTATMTGMYSGEEYEQTTNPWRSWASGTEYKHVGAVWYNPDTEEWKRYVGMDNSDSWEPINEPEKNYSSASYVYQNKNKWSAIAAQFDDSGNPLFVSGFVTTAGFATMFSEALGTDPEELVIRAEISTFITEDEVNGKISNIKLTADNVDINNGVVQIDKDSANIGGFDVSEKSLTNLYAGTSSGASIYISNAEQTRFSRLNGGTETVAAEFRNDLGTAVSITAYGSSENYGLLIRGNGDSKALHATGSSYFISRRSNSEFTYISGLKLCVRTGSSLASTSDYLDPYFPAGTQVDFLVVTGNISLPDASTCRGKVYFLKRRASGSITVPSVYLADGTYKSSESWNDDNSRAFISDGVYWNEFYCK